MIRGENIIKAISIGNHTSGYHIAEVSLIDDQNGKTGKHKLKLIGHIKGDKTLITKAIESYNRGFSAVVTSTGEELPIIVTTRYPYKSAITYPRRSIDTVKSLMEYKKND